MSNYSPCGKRRLSSAFRKGSAKSKVPSIGLSSSQTKLPSKDAVPSTSKGFGNISCKPGLKKMDTAHEEIIVTSDEEVPKLVLVGKTHKKSSGNSSKSTKILRLSESSESSDSDRNNDSDGAPYDFCQRKKRNKPDVKYTVTRRPRDPIWASFETILLPGQKRPKTTCKLCKQEVSGELQRLKNHRVKCIPKKTTISVTSLSSSPDPAATFDPEAGPSGRQSTLESFVRRTNETQKRKIDEAVANFIFSMNIPFATVENQQFKDLLRLMLPGYTPPSRRAIADVLLTKSYTNITKTIQESLTGKEVTILQDGWSTNQNHPVIAHSLVAGGKSYFTNAVETGSSSKTAEFCLEQLINEINEVEEKYNVKVVGCVTDNCSVMRSMRRKLEQIRPTMFVYGCHSHLLNLVGKDLTPAATQEKVLTVQHHFRNVHYASGLLQELNGSRPLVPVDTRWNSQLDAFESFLKNQVKYLEVSRQAGNLMPAEVREVIENNDLYTEVLKTCKTLKPIALSLDMLQGDGATIADGVECWRRLEEGLGPLAAMPCVTDRMEMAITDFAVAAHMLHPRYRGVGLSDAQKDKGISYLYNLNPKFLVISSNLRIGNGDFFPAHFLETEFCRAMDPCDWWRLLSDSGRVPLELVQLAITLLGLPASTGGMERCFSTLGNILTKKRNRLDLDKCKMLCYVYQYFRNQQSSDMIDEDSRQDRE